MSVQLDFVCQCNQTLFIECMAVEAMPMRLIMSGWHLPEVDWTDPRYVNSVTSSSEWPQTGGQGKGTMKVIHFVSKEDNVICIVQVSEGGRCPVKNQFWRQHAPWSNQLRSRTEQEREHGPVWHRRWWKNWGRTAYDKTLIWSWAFCPSVHLSRSGILWKLLNILSYSFLTTQQPIILALWLLNISAKFRWGHPLQRCLLYVGYKNFAIFDQ